MLVYGVKLASVPLFLFSNSLYQGQYLFMRLSFSSAHYTFHKITLLTSSIRHALLVSSAILLSMDTAFANIVIDDDATEGATTTIIAPNNHIQAVDFSDNSGAAIRINDSNGANGLLTINGGVTVSSSDLEAVVVGGGGTASVSITNAGTLSSVLNGLLVQDGAELTAFDNTGGIIEATGTGAGLYLQEDQDNAITNAGIIRNTANGDGLKLDSEAQTQDFTNTGTISSNSGIAINADTAMAGATNGFVNTGTISGGGAAIDAEAAFTLTNSGTVTGNIEHATSGALIISQTAGAITGNITSTADAAHSLNLTGGSITGNITLNGTTANTFVLDGATINGNVDLGDGAANSVTLTTGSLLGSLDIGTGTTAVSINTGVGDAITVTTFDTLTSTVSMSGAGTFNSTTFSVNGTLNQSAGTLSTADFNIGDNDTVTQTGTGVINSTTTRLGSGATLTLKNQGSGQIQGGADDRGNVIFSGNYNTDAALGISTNTLASVTVNTGQVLTLDQNADVLTFNNNGTVNQSAGTANITTLNIGDNDTYTQTGSGVLNTTTTKIGSGATLTLNNQGTGLIQGTADNQGALVFSGNYNTDAALGTVANTLASVTVNGGSTLTLDQNSDVTTFTNNGTVNQTAGTLAATTLNIGASDTLTQTGTGVINSTTTNIGAGGSLTLLNQGTGLIQGTADNQGALVFSGNYNTDAALGTAANTLASVTVNTGQTLTLDQNADVTTFNNNGTVNQSAGTANISTLNIAAGETITQTGTGILNTTTTKIGSGATLTLNNQGTGLIQGTADNQGAVVFSGSYNTDAALGTVANTLASVTVNGGSTLTLDQNSDVTTFTNNGTVNQTAGTLAATTLNIGASDTLTQTGTGVINSTTTNIGNGATLTLNNQGTGLIQGTADNQGALVFSGNYNTDAALGTAANTLASVTVNDGQTLTLDQNADVTTFNNNGTVNQSAGTANMTTLNIDAGDTFTQSGTGAVNATNINLGNASTLIVNNQGTGAIQGTADGDGDLVFSGNYNTDAALGTSANSLASITVNAGQTLTLDQASDAISLAIAGVLDKSTASAMVGNTTINDGGQLNIANNFTHTGNLTVGQAASAVVSVDAGVMSALVGNYTQTTGGIFQLGADSNTNFGQMTVTGTATFASNAKFDVDVNMVNTLAIGETLSSVVSATSLVSDGTFKVTDNSALFNFTGAINGNAIDIFVVNADSVVDIVGRTGSPAAVGAAAVFDDWVLNGGDTPGVADVLAVFGPLETEQEVADAIESSLPGLSGGIAQATSFATTAMTSLIGSRQDVARGLSSGDDIISDKNFWIAPYGSWTDQDDRQGVSGYQVDSYGLAIGVDEELSPWFNLGLAFAYTRSDIESDLAFGRHSVDVDSYQAKLYATAMLSDATALNLQLGAGRSDYDSKRRVFTLDVAEVEYDSWHAQVNAELEHSLYVANNFVMTPYIYADYSYVAVEGYEEENAAALNLTVEQDSNETLIVGVGAKADYAASSSISILADAAVGYDFMARRSSITSSFEGGGGTFSTIGIKPDELVYRAGLGFRYSSDNGSEITANYNFYGREDYTDQALSIKYSMYF